MQTQTINLTRGAFGQPSVPFLLSRRGGGIPPVGRAVRSSRSAFQRFSKGGRQFYRSYGYRFFCDTRFLFTKKTKTGTRGR